MKIVILDRDGVINVDSAHYIKSVDEWQPIPGSIDAISLLCRNDYSIYVATNQAGIARGLYTTEILHAIHAKMTGLVESAGGRIEGIFFCPHHPDAHCECRKPGIGLLNQIELHARTSVRQRPFVGDSLKDIQAATTKGCQPVLVRTGNGATTLKTLPEPVDTYDDLLDFAQSLVQAR